MLELGFFWSKCALNFSILLWFFSDAADRRCSSPTDMYVKDIKTGICNKDGEPVVEKESAATALVDGRNLLGPVVGNFCMKLAIQKAKEVGIGWVVAHGRSPPPPTQARSSFPASIFRLQLNNSFTDSS